MDTIYPSRYSNTWCGILCCFRDFLCSNDKIRIKNFADNGDKRAINAIHISDNFDRALTTLLISNNVMHIGFGSLAALISVHLWGVKSVKYTTIITAVFVFLFSELIPKSYAKAHSEKFALAVSGSLRALIKILSPISFLFTFISRTLSKFFPESREPDITEEELYDIIETAQEEGVINEDEQELVNSALTIDNITAGDIFTKRSDIIALDIKSTHKKILEKINTQKYTRMPVYKDNIDNIVGILHIRKYLKACIKNDSFKLSNLLLPPHVVSKDTPIYSLLRQMSRKKLHMSLVKSGDGKTIGIVTMEDILQELVGDLYKNGVAKKRLLSRRPAEEKGLIAGNSR